MRNNVFEKIKINKLSVNKSMNIILSEILQYHNYEYLISLFKQYEYNYLYIDINDFIQSSFMFFDFSYRNFNQWHLYIDDNKIDDDALSEIFDFLEHIINIVGYEYRDYRFERMFSVISKLVESLGYKFSNYEDKAVIVENDPVVENIVTNIKEDNTRKSIYEFLIARRKGDLVEQKKALKLLSEPVETIVNKYKRNYSFFSDISRILQCIRHNPEEKKEEYPFYYNDLKKWYDITFNQFIFAFSFEHMLEGQKEFKYNSNNIINE